MVQVTTEQRVFVVPQSTQTPNVTAVVNHLESDFENEIKFH